MLQTSAQEFPGAGPVRKVASGFGFTEGPADDGKGNLYFTDIPNQRIHRIDAKGNVSTVTEKSLHCNGLMFDGDGKLYGCQMDGRLARIDAANGESKSLVDQYDGKRFNACNDLVIDKQGGIYFTDPRFMAPDPWPQGKEAVYYRSAKGDVERIESELAAPNGVILSPNEKTLYVVPSMQKEVIAFDVNGSGKVSKRRVFFELKQPQGKENSGGDGLSIDVEGNLYFTSDLGVQVVSSKGKLLGIIEFPEQPANCSFGGPNHKTLFATCRTSVYAVDLPIAGHVFQGIVP